MVRVFVGHADRVEIARREAHCGQPPLELARRKPAVDQDSIVMPVLASLADQRVALAAGAETAEAQHGRARQCYFSCSVSWARILSRVALSSGLPSLSSTRTLLTLPEASSDRRNCCATIFGSLNIFENQPWAW